MRFGFEHWEYLWALLVLPPLWWLGARQAGSLGKRRAWAATLLRSLVVIAIVAAASGFQVAWDTERVAVIYVLDQSDSVDPAARRRMRDYVVQSVRTHRDSTREDLAGVVVFGRDASIEVPPFPDDLPELSQLERVPVQTDATDLEEAIELAQGSMPPDSRHRIVVVTDGNQTRGEADSAAARAAAAGVGIDVVPVGARVGADVTMQRVDLPTDIRRGQPFDARVVLDYQPGADNPSPASGRLTVTRSAAGVSELVLDDTVQLRPGKNVIPLRHQIDLPAAYQFEARFIPDGEADDSRRENNRASAFTRIRGEGRVLLVEPWNQRGAWRALADRLREERIKVVVQPSNATFTSLAELQGYDAVILANVPKTSGNSAETLSTVTDDQVEMLVRNTQQLGAGLLMIGGPDAFGAGGWTGSPLEEAMPVDFDIKNTEIRAVGALMLVIDSSGSMSGEKIQLCKAAAAEAVKTLRRDDYVGVLTFDGETREIIPLQRIGDRSHVVPMIRRIRAGGGTNMYPAMARGHQKLIRADAAAKHMIVLTDGQTQPGDFRELTRDMRERGITVSSVAIGQGADLDLMRRIATIGNGKLYHVLSPRAIPKIIMRESRRVSRPLVFEDSRGIQPRQEMPHAVMQGVAAPPPITGFVMTTPKDNPLVQNLVMSPRPGEFEHPILSVWQYGLGRTAALTTDGGQRWATGWSEWPGQQKLASQLVRWLMRPSGPVDDLRVATTVRDGEVQVVVNAIDEDKSYRDFLDLTAAVLDPEMKPVPLDLKQTGPGRYVGSFPAERAGGYLVHVASRPGAPSLITGVNVPYGREFRDRESNLPLIKQVASVTPKGGDTGVVTAALDDDYRETLASNPFRGGLRGMLSFQQPWPWLVLLGCYLLLCDVAVRRVRLNFAWLLRAAGLLKRQPAERPQVTRLDALRKTKQQLQDDRAPARPASAASRRRETTPDDRGEGSWVGEFKGGAAGVAAGAGPKSDAEHSDEEAAALSYTQRLLEAKRRSRR